MPELNKKRIAMAGLIGGSIFCLVVLFIDYVLGRGFSWQRLLFYFVFGVLMYAFLTYRNFKKQNKKKP